MRARGLLLVPVLLLAGCSDPPSSPAEQYGDGYRFGQDGIPSGHVGVPTSDDDTAGADSECGEHAETEGVTPFPPSDQWMAGCVDGALGRPRAADPTQRP